MSVSTDVLAKATPTRLICRGGRWMLELTRLEAVDRDVYQPRLQRLEGSESILAVLRRTEENQPLASSAAQLMRVARVDEDRAFDASEGDWVPSSEPLRHAREPVDAEVETADLSRLVAELRAEVVVLRASHSRLRDRVVALEAVQSGIAQPNLRPRGSRSRRRSEPPPAGAPLEPAPGQPLPEGPGFAATQASPGPGVAPSPAPGLAPRPPAALGAAPSFGAGGPQTFEEMAAALSAGELPALLGLPGLRSLSECMSTLMDQAPELQARATPMNLESLVKPQACKLLDDEGRERGVIIADLTAAVLLGGALLAVPRDEALRQVRDNEPSEDALLAMSEICNNLTGPVNSVAGNAHVRATALAGLELDSLPQLRSRLDLTVDGGTLIIGMF
jgi:hypothetical protein